MPNRRLEVSYVMDTEDLIVKRVPRQYRAYVVIVAGVCLQFSFGLVYTFGNILPYLVSYLRWKVNPEQTNGSLIWLQSFMSGLPFAMLVGGVIERRFGARTGVAIGSTMFTGGLYLSYFSIQRSYAMLLFTLGFISSFGQGIAYVNVLTQCQRWFPSNLGAVSGIITAGFGSSAFLISPIQTKFVNPDNVKVDEDGFFKDHELLERVPRLFLLLASLFAVIQIVATLFIANPSRTDVRENESLLSLDDEDENDSQSAEDDHDTDVSVRTQSTDVSKSQLVRSPTLWLLSLTLLCNAIWVQTTSGLFKAYAQSFIKDDFFLATVNSFAAVANCFSRILWGVFADKTSYQLSMSIACTIGAVLMWCLPFAKFVGSPMLYFGWICTMFSCIGATYSLIPFAVHRCFGGTNFSIAYGYCQICLAVSGFLVALNSQFVLPLVGFDNLFLMTGFTMAISLFLTLIIGRTRHGLNAVR